MNNIFRGLGIALVTPFTDDGKVDYECLSSIIEYQLSNDADFLCILATTGETPCLSPDEYWEVKEFVVKQVNGRVPILMGCGGNNTAAIVNTLKTGNFHGIDGILSVCPMYNKPTQKGLYQHYAAIAKASPLPVVLYNVPGRTGVNLAAETTLRLARDFENIVAIKEASGKVEQIDEILAKKPKDFDVISGDDSLTLHIIQQGGVGIISVVGNAIPSLFAQMVHFAMNGQNSEASQINDSLSELYKLMFVDGNPAGVKAALYSLGKAENQLRLPLVPASLPTTARIEEILKTL